MSDNLLICPAVNAVVPNRQRGVYTLNKSGVPWQVMAARTNSAARLAHSENGLSSTRAMRTSTAPWMTSYSISRKEPDQNTRLSSSAGNLETMLMREWKGSEGTLRKWL